VWPSDLVLNYGRPAAFTLAEIWPKAAVVCALLTLTGVALYRAPVIGFLGAWVFLTLAPSSSVVPIATEVGAERRMYLPLMALVACAVLVVDSFTTRRRFNGGRYVAAALLLAGSAAL